MFNKNCKAGNRRTFFMNYSDNEELIRIRIEKKWGIPTIWDTSTGDVSDAVIVNCGKTYQIVELRLPPTHGIVLVTEK